MLRLEEVTVGIGDVEVLHEVRLDVSEHQILSVLGPSGSGKSTLLRAVAGLQPLTRGRILLEDSDLSGVPPHRRGVGLMFQDQQLFPQRDVAGNVSFGLDVRRVSRSGVRQRVDELLGLVGLSGAGEREISTLSGGEQQRVALARALAPQPRLLMLDEPLGQLDRGLRERLVIELRQLFKNLGTTVLAVTHDQSEAFALADQVAVMDQGRVRQVGSPWEVWSHPNSEFVARFLGFENIVEATLKGDRALTPWGSLPLPEKAEETGEGRKVLVRPGGVRIGPREPGLPCRVRARVFRGDHVLVHLLPLSGPPLQASCSLREAAELPEEVGVTFDSQEVVPLPASSLPT
ncbi:ABC transporter ATP-binding protein [Streptomyces sp. NPDC005438]|uniref:ABC transporter ATP-binding protein n=1 Tax=Streptomyces sp. NPDC005438 TaxID=3156880 RepID=UPI0033B46F9D